MLAFSKLSENSKDINCKFWAKQERWCNCGGYSSLCYRTKDNVVLYSNKPIDSKRFFDPAATRQLSYLADQAADTLTNPPENIKED